MQQRPFPKLLGGSSNGQRLPSLTVDLLANRPEALPRQASWENETSAQREGRRHEDACHAAFEAHYGDWYVKSPWFRYARAGPHWERRRWRYCQPDGLLFRPDGRLIIVEAKLAHTIRAYNQLAGLYQPVMEAAFPPWTVCLLEVVRWYRSDVSRGGGYPVPVYLIGGAEAVEPEKFNVMILQRSQEHGSKRTAGAEPPDQPGDAGQ